MRAQLKQNVSIMMAGKPLVTFREVYFFIKKEGGRISGNVKSLNYKPLPISSVGLEVP